MLLKRITFDVLETALRSLYGDPSRFLKVHLVSSFPAAAQEDLKVEILVDVETRTYDSGLIANLLLPTDAEAVKQTYLFIQPSEDKMVWKGITDGSIAIKSAYNIENNFPLTTSSTSSTGWSKIWFTNVAPKIKLFWWKLVHII